jgi:hypothetical protein
MQARLIFGIREKSEIWAKHTSLQTDVQFELFPKTLPFCMDIFLPAPTHSIGFWQTSQVYTYPRRVV